MQQNSLDFPLFLPFLSCKAGFVFRFFDDTLEMLSWFAIDVLCTIILGYFSNRWVKDLISVLFCKFSLSQIFAPITGINTSGSRGYLSNRTKYSISYQFMHFMWKKKYAPSWFLVSWLKCIFHQRKIFFVANKVWQMLPITHQTFPLAQQK